MDSSIFREYDIRGIYPSAVSEKDAEKIGRGFGSIVIEACGVRASVVVGYDGRLSSPSLRDALVAGLLSTGCNVIHVGLGPSPELYFASCTLKADGAVMVTGSHNPPDQNGFKFMLKSKAFFGDAIRALQQRIIDAAFIEAPRGGEREQSVQREYAAALHAAYDGERVLDVVWDPGNGAAGEVTAVLAEMMPGRHVLLNAEIDGHFPSHHPDPTLPENLAQLCDAVRANGFDLGIAFDGDGDRIGVVDNEGEIIWGDQLLVFLAEDVLAHHPGATIIADVKASQTLFDEIERMGGVPYMAKTGHSHIKAKMAEIGALLAGEMSGHVFFADRYFGYDDALYAAVRLLGWLSRKGEKLSDLRRRLPGAVATPEVRFPCDDARKFAVIDEVRARLEAQGARFSDVDGVRVMAHGGWWLLRASNTQPMLTVRCEAPDEKRLELLKNQLKEQLAESGVSLII